MIIDDGVLSPSPSVVSPRRSTSTLFSPCPCSNPPPFPPPSLSLSLNGCLDTPFPLCRAWSMYARSNCLGHKHLQNNLPLLQISPMVHANQTTMSDQLLPLFPAAQGCLFLFGQNHNCSFYERALPRDLDVHSSNSCGNDPA
jgi:hypothetical protein